MRVYSIGSSRSCDIVLRDKTVSRQHAKFLSLGDGSYEISDNESTNGTFVHKDGDWVRVEKAVVNDSDVVLLGALRISVDQLVQEITNVTFPRETDAIADDPSDTIDTEPRRLTTILAMDAVGFARLMGEDEDGTLRQLAAARSDVVDPELLEKQGRIIKTTGDGLLAEFRSANDAVACAISIQRTMAVNNQSSPDDNRICFRIGVSLGDVIDIDDDIFGEGVNIAARLEAVAEPGGVCIAGSVYDLLQPRFKVGFQDLGPTRLKNISSAVRVFSLVPSLD